MIELKDTIAGMTSADYKERFKAEFQQTYIRWQKLADMIEKHKSGTLDFTPTCPIELLENQQKYMQWMVEVYIQRAFLEKINLLEGLF